MIQLDFTTALLHNHWSDHEGHRRAQRHAVRDARRRRVLAVSTRGLARAEADTDGRRHALVKRLRTQTKEAMWKLMAAHALWLMVVAAIWSRFEDDIIGRNAFQGLPRGAAVLAALALIAITYWWLATRASRVRRSRLAVKAGFCGSCGYDLMGLPRLQDGVVVCPECGSAWQVRCEPVEPASHRAEEKGLP